MLAVTLSLLMLVAVVVVYFVLKGLRENPVPNVESDNQSPSSYYGSNMYEPYSEGYPEN